MSAELLTVTGAQILAHLVGDYLTQSDWQASMKLQRSFPAAVHALLEAEFQRLRDRW